MEFADTGKKEAVNKSHDALGCLRDHHGQSDVENSSEHGTDGVFSDIGDTRGKLGHAVIYAGVALR